MVENKGHLNRNIYIPITKVKARRPFCPVWVVMESVRKEVEVKLGPKDEQELATSLEWETESF